MKKYLSIIAVAFLINVSFAQQTSSNLIALKSLDSLKTTAYVVNTGSVIMFTEVTSSWESASIQLVETKNSGTVAGTAVLVASNDGINFVDISRASVAATVLHVAYTDTLTSTNVTTNTKIWVISNSAQVSGNTPAALPYRYYGIKKTGSGTMNSKVKAYMSARHN